MEPVTIWLSMKVRMLLSHVQRLVYRNRRLSGAVKEKNHWRPSEMMKVSAGSKVCSIMSLSHTWTFIRCLVFTIKGSKLMLQQANRNQMGAYLCIATNGIPPSVSKRITLVVNCTNYPNQYWTWNLKSIIFQFHQLYGRYMTTFTHRMDRK